MVSFLVDVKLYVDVKLFYRVVSYDCQTLQVNKY